MEHKEMTILEIMHQKQISREAAIDLLNSGTGKGQATIAEPEKKILPEIKKNKKK